MNNELYHHGIKDMKWGVRRYQNKDGTLTEAGKKRYAKDVQANLSKKKGNRIDTSTPDPERWVTEDMQRTKKTIDSTNNMVNELKKVERDTRPDSTKKKMDLSNMSDKEMRDAINREMLERQYTSLFGEDNTSNGRKTVQTMLNDAGTALAVAGSSVALALSLRELIKGR